MQTELPCLLITKVTHSELRSVVVNTQKKGRHVCTVADTSDKCVMHTHTNTNGASHAHNHKGDLPTKHTHTQYVNAYV